MTQLTCDKMNSHGSIKTFRVNKVYRAVKKRESFSSTLFIYSKYSPLHPPPSRNGFAVLFTNKKEPQKSQMKQRIKAKLKRLSDSCKITQEIWRRCCRVPKFCTVHISVEVLYIQVGYKMFRKNIIFVGKLPFIVSFHMNTRVLLKFWSEEILQIQNGNSSQNQ